MDGYQRILVPLDFSENTAVVLQHARRLADVFRSSLHLLHVLEDPLADIVLEDGYGLPDDFREQIEQHARKRLETILTSDERARYRADVILLHGTPFVEIVGQARERQVDLIVIGTHGRGAVAHMLLGSVAERVVRKAPCPVLVVRNLHAPP